jgi:hypothetical protein
MVQPHRAPGGLVLQGTVTFLKADSPSKARDLASEEAMKAAMAGARGKKKDNVTFSVTVDAVPPVQRNYRMVAIDREGHAHPLALMPQPPWPVPTVNSSVQLEGVCWDIPREQVKEFRFQVGKPLRQIEFRNVPLYSGHCTKLEVTVDGKPYQPKPVL